MNLTNNPIIIIIIIAIAIILLINRFCKRAENFAPMDADLFNTPNYKPLDPKMWASQWYQAQKDPSVNIPLEKLYQKYDKLPTKMLAHQIRVQEEEKFGQGPVTGPVTVPVPRNIPTGQTEQVASVPGNENITQVGAPLTEVIEQEVQLVQPLPFMSPELQEIMRQEQMKLAELNSQYQQPQNLVQIQPEFQHPQGMTPEARQAEMEQKIRGTSEIESQKLVHMANHIRSEVAPEVEYRHAEVVPEYGQSETEVGSLIQDLSNSEEMTEHKIEEAQNMLEQELMPGMEQKVRLEQKARLEQELSEQLGEKVIVKVQVENNNLALAIFLSVLLVGFVYNTSG